MTPLVGQRPHLGEHVAGTTVLLFAAQARHDAERAGVVAAHRDRDPGRVGGLAPGRQDRGERLERFLELRLCFLPLAGALEQGWQRADVVRAEHDVDPGGAPGDRGPLHLGQAAAHRDLHAGCGVLDREQVPQVAVQPVGGVLPHGAGVEHEHVGRGAAGSALVAGVLQQAGQPLGVVRVHLAPVGADLIRARRGVHDGYEGTRPARWLRSRWGQRTMNGAGFPHTPRGAGADHENRVARRAGLSGRTPSRAIRGPR